MRNRKPTVAGGWRFITNLPALALSRVFHVGSLAGRGAQSAESLEGPCLSVSLHPRAWTSIARLGGLPCWTIALKGKKLRVLDMHAIGEEGRRRILAEAISRNLLTPVTAYRAWHFDEEAGGGGDGWRFGLHETRKEAEAEIEDPDAGPNGCAVEPVPGYTASASLSAWWFSGTGKPGGRVPLHLSEDAAILFLAHACGAYDGAWWDELLDPLALSAPRGALFPDVIACAVIRKTKPAGTPPEEE